MITIHPANPESLARTRVGTPTRTMRALVATDDDNQVVGVVGMYADGYRMVLFADLSDTIRADKRALIRGYRAVLNLAAAKKAPVHAVADPEIPGSRTLLEHMGFRHLNGDLFAWHS